MIFMNISAWSSNTWSVPYGKIVHISDSAFGNNFNFTTVNRVETHCLL